jgi:predicted RNA-binding protein YlxR (DUF448 family)
MIKQPVRTCLGCHGKFPKGQLLKFVIQEDTVVLDEEQKAHGRSAYCCRKKDCKRIFMENRSRLSRAFRVRNCKINVELED